VTDSNPTSAPAGRALSSPVVSIPLAIVLVSIFIALLFPWDSVARRVAHEIALASGSQISIRSLSPGLSVRGPVLSAQGVVVEHPAVERVRIDVLEIAPRLSTGWITGKPLLRVWADTSLAKIDGLLQLGDPPSFSGQIDDVTLEHLPLRIESSGMRLTGSLAATADVGLDPRGVLTGRVEFECASLVVESDQLPIAIPFSRAHGVIEILDSGATRIESLHLEGDLITGDIDGEIAMAHRSQSPPIDLSAHIRIVQPYLRGLAPSAGIALGKDGEASLRVRGTLDSPEIQPLPKQRRG
jgi:type II secretion system protein N